MGQVITNMVMNAMAGFISSLLMENEHGNVNNQFNTCSLYHTQWGHAGWMPISWMGGSIACRIMAVCLVIIWGMNMDRGGEQ